MYKSGTTRTHARHAVYHQTSARCGSVWLAINAYNAADGVGGEVYRINSASERKSCNVTQQYHGFDQRLDPMMY